MVPMSVMFTSAADAPAAFPVCTLKSQHPSIFRIASHYSCRDDFEDSRFKTDAEVTLKRDDFEESRFVSTRSRDLRLDDFEDSRTAASRQPSLRGFLQELVVIQVLGCRV